MKLFSSNISRILCLLAVSPFLGACVYDNFPEGTEENPGHGPFDDGIPRVILKISPVNYGAAVDANVKEKIETLRIVMINQTDDNSPSYIEINNLIEFGQGGSSGSENSGNTPTIQTGGVDTEIFKYVFTRPTVPGKKRFYLIANERSVKDIHFQGQTTLPEGLSEGMALTDFLTHYYSDEIPGFNDPDYENGTGGPSGLEFETLMNSIYFGSAYVPNNENNIYLPYTAFYDGYTIVAAEEHESKDQFIDADMFLVPVATKFRFRFENYRNNPVDIEELSLGGIALNSFAMAHVNEPDYFKTLYEEERYWVDWLREVSRLSQGFTDLDGNMEFNQLWGWIDSYNVPSSAYVDDTDGNYPDYDSEGKPSPVNILGNIVLWNISQKHTIDPGQENDPSVWETGYYYLPESRFLVPVLNETNTDYKKDAEGNKIYKQEYYISAKIKDIGSGVEAEDQYADFTNNTIGNLKSLFRNTNILITITMNDWDKVGAYADVEPWNPQSNNGYLQEEVVNK